MFRKVLRILMKRFFHDVYDERENYCKRPDFIGKTEKEIMEKYPLGYITEEDGVTNIEVIENKYTVNVFCKKGICVNAIAFEHVTTEIEVERTKIPGFEEMYFDGIEYIEMMPEDKKSEKLYN